MILAAAWITEMNCNGISSRLVRCCWLFHLVFYELAWKQIFFSLDCHRHKLRSHKCLTAEDWISVKLIPIFLSKCSLETCQIFRRNAGLPTGISGEERKGSALQRNNLGVCDFLKILQSFGNRSWPMDKIIIDLVIAPKNDPSIRQQLSHQQGIL